MGPADRGPKDPEHSQLLRLRWLSPGELSTVVDRTIGFLGTIP